MKTVRTRVKSAFKRSSRGTPSVPPAPLKLPAASTSAPSILIPENVKSSTAPPVSPVKHDEQTQHYPDFRFESEPQSADPTANDQSEKQDGLDLKDFAFTGDEPEHVYVPPQPVIVANDSKRSTPKKRIKLQATLPPSNDTFVNDIKFVSPVDPHYLLDDIRNPEPSLLDQPAPTDRYFVEHTPQEVPSLLPPLHEVLAQQAHTRRLDSSTEPAGTMSYHDTHEEDKPLLDSSLLTAEVDDILDSVWPLPPQTFLSLGWTEHVLPSSSYYYSHAATRTVTDIDLRNEKRLATVTSYLKSKWSPASDGEAVGHGKGNSADEHTIRNLRVEPTLQVEEGVDLWLRDANPGLPTKGGSEWEFMPMRNWVMHATRAVTFKPPSDYQADEDLSDEDRLDLENRYWQYMSIHPAHASLPQNAHDEALEVLTWCYADRVLRNPQPLSVPQPFTQKECMDLLDLLRNVSGPSISHSTQTTRTRLIAQILLRYTEWRQTYVTKSCPEKYNNTLSGRLVNNVEHAVPFRRTLLELFKTVFCLGIPYLFDEIHGYDRWNPNRNADEEEQAVTRPPRPSDVLLGSSQPLVAALLLSASVTLLVLPELNAISRVAALTSALFAAASLASFVITLYGRSRRRVLESPTGLSHRAILTALPLVMLAYSLCAFVVGVIAYSITSHAAGFGRYTGWAIAFVLIALVVILATSAAVTKKEL